MKCVFNSQKNCPVRKEIRRSLQTKKKLDGIIKPLGDTELQKMFVPIFDKLQESLHAEFGVLHNYCQVCPSLKGEKIV